MRVHIILGLGLFGAGPVATYGLWEAQRWGDDASAHADALSVQLAAAASDAIVDRLHHKTEVLQALAGGLSGDADWSAAHLQPIMDAQIAKSQAFDSVYLGDVGGTSLVFAPSVRADGVLTVPGVSYRSRDYYLELIRTHSVAYSHVQLGKQSGVANVMIAVPIHGPAGSDGAPCDEAAGHAEGAPSGPLRGYLTAGVSLAELTALANRTMEGDSKSRLLVLDGDGRVLIDSAGRQPALSTLQPGGAGGVCTPEPTEGEDEGGVRVRQRCRPIHLGAQRWQLWVSTPTAHIEAAAGRAREGALQAAMLILGLAVAASATTAFAISRRVKRAAELVNHVAAGDLSHRPGAPQWYVPKEVADLTAVVSVALDRLAGSDGEVRGLVARLEQANSRMAPLADAWAQVGEAIEILDGDGVVRFVNPAHTRIVGDPFGVGHRSPLADTPNLMQAARDGQPWRGELQVETPLGLRVQALTCSPVLDANGQLSRVVIIRRDITDRRLAEAAAANNERLAAVGTLAAGLAHEINNPLMVIQGALHQHQAEPSAPSTEAALREAAAAAGKAASIVHALLGLSAPGLEGTQPDADVALDELLRSCAVLAAPLTRPRIRVWVEVDGAPVVRGRRADLAQVVMGLITNAAQAHAEGSTDSAWIRLRAGATTTSSAGEVWLEVSDNGPGMAADVLRRAFDPFFTTRDVGAGAGLGLSLARQIAEAHRGRLTLRSTPGTGTTARLTMPMRTSAAEAEARPAPTKPAPPVAARTPPRRVLVVDDDPPVARSVARMLRGHDVHIAIGGEEALARLANERFDVVISDVMMPGIDGPTLYAAATRGWPELRERFAFVTGAATIGSVADALRRTERPVLLKPLDPAQIRSLVDTIGAGAAA